MSIGCSLCLLPGGRGIGPSKGGIFEEEGDYLEHLEMEHDLVVKRKGETEEQAIERVTAKNPRLGGPGCQCPGCRALRDWR